jgi:hypothetical protein
MLVNNDGGYAAWFDGGKPVLRTVLEGSYIPPAIFNEVEARTWARTVGLAAVRVSISASIVE